MTASTREHVIVGGTTFSFPTVPDDAADEAKSIILGRREEILRKAKQVKPVKRLRRASRLRTLRPGNGVFDPEQGDPGSVIAHGGRRFEVWSEAPAFGGSRARWCTVAGSRSWWRVNARGSVEELTPEAQREAVVDAFAEKRLASAVCRLVPTPDNLPRSRWGHHDFAAPEYRSWEARRRSAREWVRAQIAHSLYPDHYPHPGEWHADEPKGPDGGQIEERSA